MKCKFSHIIGFSRIPRYRRKRTVSLRVFGENAAFHSAYLPKTRNSAPSLNMLFTAESEQFNSPFSPTTISVTPRFRRKREVWLPFFAENAQNDPKTHSYEDNAKFHSAFSLTTLSYTSRFRWNRGVIENFEYLGEFEEDFCKCWLYCVLYLLAIERFKNKLKNRLWKSRACVPLRCRISISPCKRCVVPCVHIEKVTKKTKIKNVIWKYGEGLIRVVSHPIFAKKSENNFLQRSMG